MLARGVERTDNARGRAGKAVTDPWTRRGDIIYLTNPQDSNAPEAWAPLWVRCRSLPPNNVQCRAAFGG